MEEDNLKQVLSKVTRMETRLQSKEKYELPVNNDEKSDSEESDTLESKKHQQKLDLKAKFSQTCLNLFKRKASLARERALL